MAAKLNVVITGATSRTASFLVGKLVAAEDKFNPPVGIVRSLSKAKSMFEDIWSKVEQGFHEVPNIAADDSVDKMVEAFKGANVLVILTGAVGKFENGKIVFSEGGDPETVDWIGQKNQIDAAKKAGISHVVMVASMGTTNVTDPTVFGGYHVFKRKSQEYLLATGLTYTIINPCELIDGEAGKRKFVYSKRDELRVPGYSKKYQLPRSDLAEIVFHSLLEPNAKNKVFDVLGELVEEGTPSNDFPVGFKTTTPGL